MKSRLLWIFCLFSQEHANYITRDSKVGPILLSIKTEQDYQGTFYRALVRMQKVTFYKVMQKVNLPDHMEPEDFIKVCVQLIKNYSIYVQLMSCMFITIGMEGLVSPVLLIIIEQVQTLYDPVS